MSDRMLLIKEIEKAHPLVQKLIAELLADKFQSVVRNHTDQVQNVSNPDSVGSDTNPALRVFLTNPDGTQTLLLDTSKMF